MQYNHCIALQHGLTEPATLCFSKFNEIRYEKTSRLRSPFLQAKELIWNVLGY